MAHPVRISLGVVCLVLGVVGAILPILQGWLFFALAGAFFFPRHRWVYSGLGHAERHMPRLVAFLRRHGIGHTASI
ncbi:MAG: hypothetical protein HYU52_06670 [Acidobacteria bacterium]|nr:hypothetical protein [Acidobacteriota bacterium]